MNHLSSKFKELRSLVYEYKEKKDQEISHLTEDQDNFKKEIEKNKENFEKIIEMTTDKIESFLQKANSQN